MRRVLSASASALLLTAGMLGRAQAPASCDQTNPIVCENLKLGTPPEEWEVRGAGDSTIQGFATDISVDQGETVRFKVNTPAANWRADIYRLGYYGGLGARKVATVQPPAAIPRFQPPCVTDAATGLVDCGNWSESVAWSVPADATSGIYLARFVRLDTGGASHAPFIVRADRSRSDLLFQTSDTTWQAYNNYGGASLYVGRLAENPHRAFKVSYNRPFLTRAYNSGRSWLFNAEYPMLRWLEANGYDVSYFSGVDTDRRGEILLQHRVFLSVGHDEYWSRAQRTHVEEARAAGVHLAFFSGNEVYWKIRWEPGIAGSPALHRTLVCYKESQRGQRMDPANPPTWTGLWRDGRLSPPADGGIPENALTGTRFFVDGFTSPRQDAIQVPAELGALRFWRNTSVARLAPGATASMLRGTLGYEWDEDRDNGFRPPGLFHVSSATVDVTPDYLVDELTLKTGPGVAIHSATLYRHASGALVFGAGTIQWAWGLDNRHDNGLPAANREMQQATVNLLGDMGTQPATLSPDLAAAAASTDRSAPVSMVTSPASGSTISGSAPIMITGRASDAAGGVVAGVEVAFTRERAYDAARGSIGTERCGPRVAGWHPAIGREAWRFTWTPQAPTQPKTVIRIWTRAVDDSGNLEQPCSGLPVIVR